MPFDANGVATVTRTIAVTGQTIQAAQVNTPFADIQNMLSSTMLRTGVGQATGNLNFGGFKAVNLADATNPQDAVTKNQLDALDATSVWECVGTPVNLAGLSLVDWTGLSVYRELRLSIFCTPSTAGGLLLARVSVDNGVTFLSGASDYANAVLAAEGGSVAAVAVTANAGILITNVALAVQATKFQFSIAEFNKAVGQMYLADGVMFSSTSGNLRRQMSFGYVNSSGARNALRVLTTGGTFTRGLATLEGIRG